MQNQLLREEPAPMAPVPKKTTYVPATPKRTVPKNPESAKLLGQFEALKRMITQLDSQFEAGNVPQDQYLQKKNFLGEQIGKLIGRNGCERDSL